jgi:peptidylprolyl isomerase
VEQAKSGDTVKVHYIGRLQDGTVFDSSQGREPLSFTLGEGNVIEGFETAVMGLEPGATTTAEIPPDQGYGPHREELVVQVRKDQIGGGLAPEVGQQLQLRLQNGQNVPVVVTDVTNEVVTIDANHPLAGKTLIFEIELVEIEG